MSLLHHHPVRVHFLFMNRNRNWNTNPSCCLKNQNQSRPCGGFSISGKTVPVPVPARDRVIDFGKYKGKMLGSIPSSYLKWVSNNLRAGDFVEWANLADQVLRDPIYRDRIEWEFAHNVLTGNAATNSSSSSSLLEEISERFGWDNLDKAGWSQVDFDLLGTSNGGRIPRLVDVNFKDTQPKPKHYCPPSSSAPQWSWGRRRMERRERQKKMRLRRAQAEEDMTDGRNQNQNQNSSANAIANPFPGRQAFLRSGGQRNCNQSSNPSTTRNNNIC